MNQVSYDEEWFKVREYSLVGKSGLECIGHLSLRFDLASNVYVPKFTIADAEVDFDDLSSLKTCVPRKIDEVATRCLCENGYFVRECTPNRGSRRVFIGQFGVVWKMTRGESDGGGTEAQIRREAVHDIASIHDSTIFAVPSDELARRVVSWSLDGKGDEVLLCWICDPASDWAFVPIDAQRAHICLNQGEPKQRTRLV